MLDAILMQLQQQITNAATATVQSAVMTCALTFHCETYEAK